MCKLTYENFFAIFCYPKVSSTIFHSLSCICSKRVVYDAILILSNTIITGKPYRNRNRNLLRWIKRRRNSELKVDTPILLADRKIIFLSLVPKESYGTCKVAIKTRQWMVYSNCPNIKTSLSRACACDFGLAVACLLFSTRCNAFWYFEDNFFTGLYFFN